MSRESIRKALYQHVDQLVAGKDTSASILAEYPTDRTELEALFAVVRLLRKYLVSCEPAPAFRQNLHLQLVAEAVARAHEQNTLNRQSHLPTIHRRELIFAGAALGSIVSVAAVVFAQRSRHTRTAA